MFLLLHGRAALSTCSVIHPNLFCPLMPVSAYLIQRGECFLGIIICQERCPWPLTCLQLLSFEARWSNNLWFTWQVQICQMAVYRCTYVVHMRHGWVSKCKRNLTVNQACAHTCRLKSYLTHQTWRQARYYCKYSIATNSLNHKIRRFLSPPKYSTPKSTEVGLEVDADVHRVRCLFRHRVGYP